MTTWIFTALDGRTWRADGETADEAYRVHLSGDLSVPSWSMLDIEEANEPEPEQVPTEPPPPIEPFVEWMSKDVEGAFAFALAAEDCYSKATVRAVGMAREQLIEARHAQSEWLRERAALLEENARLRAEIQEWRTARRTDEIAVGYAAEEETDGL